MMPFHSLGFDKDIDPKTRTYLRRKGPGEKKTFLVSPAVDDLVRTLGKYIIFLLQLYEKKRSGLRRCNEGARHQYNREEESM